MTTLSFRDLQFKLVTTAGGINLDTRNCWLEKISTDKILEKSFKCQKNSGHPLQTAGKVQDQEFWGPYFFTEFQNVSRQYRHFLNKTKLVFSDNLQFGIWKLEKWCTTPPGDSGLEHPYQEHRSTKNIFGCSLWKLDFQNLMKKTWAGPLKGRKLLDKISPRIFPIQILPSSVTWFFCASCSCISRTDLRNLGTLLGKMPCSKKVWFLVGRVLMFARGGTPLHRG